MSDEEMPSPPRRSGRPRAAVSYNETEDGNVSIEDDEESNGAQEEEGEEEDDITVEDEQDSRPAVKKRKKQSPATAKKKKRPNASRKTDGNEDNFVCPHCQKKFLSAEGHKYHVDNSVCQSQNAKPRKPGRTRSKTGRGKSKSTRSRGTAEDRTCPSCHRVFSSLGGLSYHLSTYTVQSNGICLCLIHRPWMKRGRFLSHSDK